jgi:hypothetical protein
MKEPEESPSTGSVVFRLLCLLPPSPYYLAGAAALRTLTLCATFLPPSSL